MFQSSSKMSKILSDPLGIVGFFYVFGRNKRVIVSVEERNYVVACVRLEVNVEDFDEGSVYLEEFSERREGFDLDKRVVDVYSDVYERWKKHVFQHFSFTAPHLIQGEIIIIIIIVFEKVRVITVCGRMSDWKSCYWK